MANSVVRSGSRVIQNVRKTGKDAAGQQWLNDDGVLTLASNPKFVISIDGDASQDGTRITIQEKKAYNEKQKWYYPTGGDSAPVSPSPSRAESISIRPDNFPTGWFYIKSAASGLVVDIEHGVFTDPMKAGARAEMNHQKIDNGDSRHSLLELQLWRYDAGFLINRRTGFVLDIQGGTLKANARLVQWHRKAGKAKAHNQHWFYENGFIANVYNSRWVLDIDGDGSKDGAKIALGERKLTSNADQQWILEEARFQWLASSGIAQEVPREVNVPKTVSVLPTNGWFYIKSQSSGNVVDLEQGILSDPTTPNTLVAMAAIVTSDAEADRAKVESQLWRYQDGNIVNRRSGLVLDAKQGVVRHGARLVQTGLKQGKEGHHQRWESANGNIAVQGKATFVIDIEGDGSKVGSRLSLQKPKSQNNSDQQWVFQLATYSWLQGERSSVTVTESTFITQSSKIVPIQKDDWFFIKSGATGLVMDLEAGWITSPTDVGAYISMKKQRSLDDADKTLVERQLWRYEDGYIVNRKTKYVIDIYGRSAVVGVKLIQQHQARTDADGRQNQLWNVDSGNIQLLRNPKLIIGAETIKDGSRVQLLESKASVSAANTWTLELARASWVTNTVVRSSSYDEGIEYATITIHNEFPAERWFYIKSKASGLVLDVEHGFLRDHTKAGAHVELNGQKLQASAQRHALLELQLWRFEDGYIVNRRTGLVLDVGTGFLGTGTRIMQWSRKTTDNANQKWTVSNGFIHLRSNPNLVLDVDGDGTRDGARISLSERKDKKNLDQRWSFEAVNFTWLAIECNHLVDGNDVELLAEFEASNLARVKDHRSAPVDCWFYLKTGINDLVLEIERSRQASHLKSGAHVHLAHQRLKSGKHSHALLELQLWRFVEGRLINRRSGLALAVDQVNASANVIQTTVADSDKQRWVIEDGVLRLEAHRDFALFLYYGRQGSRAFIRQLRHGERAQSWSFAEVHFSWLTLDIVETEKVEEEEELESSSESEITFLRKEKIELRRVYKFSQTTYFFIRTTSGYVVDIEHGLFKNHMKVGACATVHPQTTAASASQHALLDIQLWSLVDGYLINKRTGLALTIHGDVKNNASLIQVLPKDALKWSMEDGYIFPTEHSHFALNVQNGKVVIVERTVAISWLVYEIQLSWLVYNETVLLTTEQQEDYEFYEEFEEVVVRSSVHGNEKIEYAKTEQHLVAPKDAWFYLVVGNKVASINAERLIEHDAEGAVIELTVQKKFASVERHALIDLQLWKLEGSYLVNKLTGLCLTVTESGTLILSSKQTETSRQQWTFSETGALYLTSSSSKVVDFVEDKAVLVDRSSSQTIWVYDSVKFSWLNSLETSKSYNVSEVEREVTQYKTVYTRYVQYITKYTITTITTRTITRRIVRVHSQSPLQNATVVESNNTTWACHLVEAGTGVNYVMQLLQDNSSNVYYVYVQWGSIEGQLEGPYETVESATKEFQEIFQSRVGIEWITREETIAESWSTVEFEYDTVVIEEKQGGEVVKDRQTAASTITSSTTTAAHSLVDRVCPIANEVNVYTESESYHTTLTQQATGVNYCTQILYNFVTKTYYVYLRWGESEYTLDGPYENVEVAKTKFSTIYKQTYGVAWEQRKTISTSEWSTVYHEFETDDHYETYVSDEEEEEVTKKTSTTVTIVKPAVSKETSWFRRMATGAGGVASVALTQVDGIWKRTFQVVNARKAKVDHVCPIAKESFVYYDEDVYDSVLVEKTTGVTYYTQLIYNSETRLYYVYVRWGESEYKLDGPHKTVELAKSAFQVTYQERFGIEWETRETTVSEKYSYEVQTYETYEEIEEIEEVVEDAEVQIILAREQVVVEQDKTVINTNIETIVTEVAIADEESKGTIIKKETGVITKPVVSKETNWFRRIATGTGAVVAGALTQVDGVWKRSVQVVNTRKAKVDHIVEESEAITIIAREKEIQVEDKTTKTTTATIETKEEVVLEEVTKKTEVVVDVETEVEVEKTTITKETGVVAKPAVSTGSSWFRRAITGAGAVVVG
ncbi:hypothetical protein BGW38_009927, partial [Lunasporangiospora selenospora]